MFFNASVFLTRFPAPRWVRFNHRLLQLSAVYFPAVGLCLGVFGALIYMLASAIFAPNIALLLLMSAAIYATGAFHEDGWADTCDALGGGYDPASVKRIMKDSRLGTYGVIGLIGILALKYVALLQLSLSLPALVVIYMVGQVYSRWLAITVMWQLPYAQDDDVSKSKPLATAVSRKTLWLSAIPLVVVLAIWAVYLVVANATAPVCAWFLPLLLGYLAREIMMRKLRRALNGFTGDGLGAVQQISEVIFYLGCAAVLVG
ncbi:MAG TPA: adenosylcobinamide-GDP ribazoletransferase [Marinagarivorans sp.]